jgi:hypothetical protein
MTPNSVVAWPAHSPYLCFVDKEEETVHLNGWIKVGTSEEPAVYHNSKAIVTCSVVNHLSMSTTLEDRPRVLHQRSHTYPFVEFLVKATYIRRLRQRSGFMFPLPRRAGNPVVAETWSNTGLRIGDRLCHPCESNPSHYLDPCEHTVCYDHFLQHAEDLPVRCAVCLQVSLFIYLFS